jgi:hypothetical protein
VLNCYGPLLETYHCADAESNDALCPVSAWCHNLRPRLSTGSTTDGLFNPNLLGSCPLPSPERLFYKGKRILFLAVWGNPYHPFTKQTGFRRESTKRDLNPRQDLPSLTDTSNFNDYSMADPGKLWRIWQRSLYTACSFTRLWNVSKYKVFQKELYDAIPNITVCRVLRKSLHLKAYKLFIIQHIDCR